MKTKQAQIINRMLKQNCTEDAVYVGMAIARLIEAKETLMRAKAGSSEDALRTREALRQTKRYIEDAIAHAASAICSAGGGAVTFSHSDAVALTGVNDPDPE